jgi:hypothetical protein
MLTAMMFITRVDFGFKCNLECLLAGWLPGYCWLVGYLGTVGWLVTWVLLAGWLPGYCWLVLPGCLVRLGNRCTVLKESSENPDFVRTRELLNGKLSDTALPNPRFSGKSSISCFSIQNKTPGY